MDEELQRKLLRQLRLSNFFMGMVTFFMFVTFAIMAFLVWTVVTFTNDVRNRAERIQTQTQETLDIRQQICSQEALNRLLSNDFCE